jgi:hypothetical protein
MSEQCVGECQPLELEGLEESSGLEWPCGEGGQDVGELDVVEGGLSIHSRRNGRSEMLDTVLG